MKYEKPKLRDMRLNEYDNVLEIEFNHPPHGYLLSAMESWNSYYGANRIYFAVWHWALVATS